MGGKKLILFTVLVISTGCLTTVEPAITLMTCNGRWPVLIQSGRLTWSSTVNPGIFRDISLKN